MAVLAEVVLSSFCFVVSDFCRRLRGSKNFGNARSFGYVGSMEKDAGQFRCRKCGEAIERKEKIRWNSCKFQTFQWYIGEH
jgi:hypothetical protein